MSHTSTARKLLTASVAITIAIAALWSVINIATVAQHYHDSRASILIGLAFGLANAISVYAFATSPAGSQARRPAIVGTIVFGVGSSAIQFHLYHQIEGVAVNAAFWFGVLGPAAEAILAWLEAAITMDAERSAQEAQEAQQADEAAALRKQLDQQRNQAAQAAQEAAALRRQLDQAQAQPAPAQPAQRAQPAQVSAPPRESLADEFTAEELAQIDEIRRIVAHNRIQTAADLLDHADGINSQRSAQRWISKAKRAGAIKKNGAGYTIA
jgi:hypothetical protein